MEEILLSLIKELPSTGLLVLFLWFVGKQFDTAMKLLKEHLDQLNALIKGCIEYSKKQDERFEVRFEEKFDNSARIKKIEDLIEKLTMDRSAKASR